MNKKIIKSFSYNQNVTKILNKNVDTKSSKDTNVQRTDKTTQKEQLRLQRSNTIPFKNSCKILEESNNKILITGSNIDNDNKKRQQQNSGKVHFNVTANKPYSAKKKVAIIDGLMAENIKNCPVNK